MVEKTDAATTAEASVRRGDDDVEPFIVAFVSSRMPMLFTEGTDPTASISFANDSFLALTGNVLAEVIGKSVFSFISDDNPEQVLSKLHKRFLKKVGLTYELKCNRKDGSHFWSVVFVNPIFNRKGEILRHFVSFVDLTKHIEEEEVSKMLIDELNHRVKNTLSTVQSIIRQAMRSNAAPQEIAEILKSRVTALSRSHDLLSRERWKSAGMWDIVRETLEPFRLKDERADRIIINGANVRFPPKAAVALAIVINELATNAVKYGALSTEKGTIKIDWKIELTPSAPQLALTWQEAGGPTVTSPQKLGFGVRVIERGLAHELNATSQVEFLPDGVVCKIRIPMPENKNGKKHE